MCFVLDPFNLKTHDFSSVNPSFLFVKYVFLKLFTCFGLPWVIIAALGLPLAVVSRAPLVALCRPLVAGRLCFGARALGRAGCSCCGLWAQSAGSAFVVLGFVVPEHVWSSWTSG